MERSSRQIQPIIKLCSVSKNSTKSNPDYKKEVLPVGENFLEGTLYQGKLSMWLRCQLIETVFTIVGHVLEIDKQSKIGVNIHKYLQNRADLD
jgi:hypothetical protein